MSKAQDYNVRVQLWDVSTGEKTGELVRESDIVTVSPLSKYVPIWTEFLSKFEKRLGQVPDPPAASTVRVSLGRNSGKSITRVRLENGKRKFLICLVVDKAEQISIMAALGRELNRPGALYPGFKYDDREQDTWLEVKTFTDVKPPKEVHGLHPVSLRPCVAILEGARKREFLYLVREK